MVSERAQNKQLDKRGENTAIHTNQMALATLHATLMMTATTSYQLRAASLLLWCTNMAQIVWRMESDEISVPSQIVEQ